MSFPDPCPGCGAETGTGENWRRAFVRYDANPNDAQEDLGWVDEIPETLHALVCSECGYVLGVFDEHSVEEAADRTSRYRVDEELR